MIYRVYSSLPSFKQLEFDYPFSILVSDKTNRSTDSQTRNRAGKSSLIDIIRFLFGGKVDADSIFRSPSLKSYTFGMVLDVGHQRVAVERSGGSPSRVLVSSEDFSEWPFSPLYDEDADAFTLPVAQWKLVLIDRVFGLGPTEVEPASSNSRDDDEATRTPTFQSLIAYFLRRQHSGGFQSPIRQSSMQQVVDYQIAISFLLGLDWSIPAKWQLVREREKQLKQLRKAARDGAFGSVIGTTAELRTELAIKEATLRQLESEIDQFVVLPQYRSLESEATVLGAQLGQLTDANSIDRRTLEELSTALDIEAPSVMPDIKRLFESVGAMLPDLIVRSFEDAKAFHDSVIRNRQSYLSGEILEIEARVASRTTEIERLSARQSQIMDILHTSGALEQFNALRSDVAARRAEVESIRQRYQAAEQMEGTKASLDVERGRLVLLLQQSYREQEDMVGRAIVTFQEYSRALYDDAGSLQIHESNNGPIFELTIPGSKSFGINSMQIFCFDLMMMQLLSERNLGPGFLIHDSHLYDGVDERQVTAAIRLGITSAKRFGYQYIVTMNSDDIPPALASDADFQAGVLPIRLTDATDDGGLFGLRF